MRERLLELLRALRQLLRLDDAVARLTGDEAGVLEQRTVEAEQGRVPLDPELREGTEHASDRARSRSTSWTISFAIIGS